ncbi:MAG: NUDIX domain-containing protein [Candidatus Bipolaricaulia bacterium]
MEEFSETLLSSSVVFEGRVLKLRVEEVELPNGRRSRREIVEHPRAVAVVPLLQSDEVVLIRQYRRSVDRILWEIPAGKLEPDEDPLTGVQRELAEEAGLGGGYWEPLARFYTSPGFCNEEIILFLARNLEWLEDKDEVKRPGDELIEPVTFSQERVIEMLVEGRLRDAKTILGISLALGLEISPHPTVGAG